MTLREKAIDAVWDALDNPSEFACYEKAKAAIMALPGGYFADEPWEGAGFHLDQERI